MSWAAGCSSPQAAPLPLLLPLPLLPSSSSSSSFTPTATTRTVRESKATELKSKLVAVYRLENREMTEEARAALAEIPISKELHIRTIDHAARAMEELFLHQGLGCS